MCGSTTSLPPENVHAVLRRLARTVPYGPGVIVANDWIELALTSIHDTGRAVFAINHGDFDFYYDLAVRHQRHHRRVRHLHRADGAAAARAAAGPPRLDLSAAVRRRHSRRRPAARCRASCGCCTSAGCRRDKGVFDLPLIDRRLRELGVDPSWTVQGAGPDEAGAARRVDRTAATFDGSGSATRPTCCACTNDHDVLVMPSRNEGLPVALLEAGAAGVVPVVSDLPSGIPEVVAPGVSGYRPGGRRHRRVRRRDRRRSIAIARGSRR